MADKPIKLNKFSLLTKNIFYSNPPLKISTLTFPAAKIRISDLVIHMIYPRGIERAGLSWLIRNSTL